MIRKAGSLPLKKLSIWITATLSLFLFASCATSAPTSAPPPPPPRAEAAFLLDTEERFFSPIIQRDRRVVLTFEMVDGATLPRAVSTEKGRGHWIPAGMRRVQFHVILPSAGFTDSMPREARGVIDLDLQPGKTYRLNGHLKEGMKDFFIADAQTGSVVSPTVDVGFFAPVPAPRGMIPVLIPIPR